MSKEYDIHIVLIIDYTMQETFILIDGYKHPPDKRALKTKTSKIFFYKPAFFKNMR